VAPEDATTRSGTSPRRGEPEEYTASGLRAPEGRIAQSGPAREGGAALGAAGRQLALVGGGQAWPGAYIGIIGTPGSLLGMARKYRKRFVGTGGMTVGSPAASSFCTYA
jgi:hypothetical protein